MEADPKCPKCGKDITEFAIRHAIVGPNVATGPASGAPVGRPGNATMDANATTAPGFYAVVVCCPHCMVIISVVAEPNAIAADVVRRLLTNKTMPRKTSGVGAVQQTKSKTPPGAPA
jgi:hypothetical protein